jgi:hypothetical protein
VFLGKEVLYLLNNAVLGFPTEGLGCDNGNSESHFVYDLEIIKTRGCAVVKE